MRGNGDGIGVENPQQSTGLVGTGRLFHFQRFCLVSSINVVPGLVDTIATNYDYRILDSTSRCWLKHLRLKQHIA